MSEPASTRQSSSLEMFMKQLLSGGDALDYSAMHPHADHTARHGRWRRCNQQNSGCTHGPRENPPPGLLCATRLTSDNTVLRTGPGDSGEEGCSSGCSSGPTTVLGPTRCLATHPSGAGGVVLRWSTVLDRVRAGRVFCRFGEGTGRTLPGSFRTLL